MWVLKTLRVLFMRSVCSHKGFLPRHTSTESTIGYNLSRFENYQSGVVYLVIMLTLALKPSSSSYHTISGSYTK